MQSSAPPLPEYDNPPVIEVIFGVQYKDLKEFQSPHIGIFWEKFGRSKYPVCKEMPPLGRIEENYGPPSSHQTIKIESMELPPLPRVFFISEEENHLIQLQRDRFVQNWRKLREDVEYPRYRQLLPQFLESWEALKNIVEELGIGQLEPDQYELTYVNHIPKGNGWETLSDIGKIFPEFQCPVGNRFLPEPEGVLWRRIYRFPEQKGRLHVSMRQAISSDAKTPLLVLNLTARGFAEGELKSWFDMAREWIVKGFADLTGHDIQKSVWKRTR